MNECVVGSKVTICAASVLINTSCLEFFLPLLKQLLTFWKTYNPVSSVDECVYDLVMQAIHVTNSHVTCINSTCDTVWY